MPRKPLIRSKEYPYHVTGRGNNREPFPCEPRESWAILGTYLEKVSLLYQAKIHALVLMPNHFHLLISTPGQDLGVVMQDFMRSVTKAMHAKTGRSGRVFGGKYHWSIITTDSYFDCALKYVYRNPVKAGLAWQAEDYRFSTLKSAMGMERHRFQLHPHFGARDLIPNNDREEFLLWLNQPFRTEDEESIRKGLRKTRFQPQK